MCWAADLHCTDMAESPVRDIVAVRARLLRCELRNHKPLFGSLRLSPRCALHHCYIISTFGWMLKSTFTEFGLTFFATWVYDCRFGFGIDGD